MKPRAPERLLVVLLPCLLAVVGCLRAFAADPAASDITPNDIPPPLGASPTVASGSNTPPGTMTAPTATAKPGKKPKAPRDPNAPQKVRKPKDIQFPLGVGSIAKLATVPQYTGDGSLLSQLMAIKMKRISNEIVEMEQAHIDLNHADGKSDFHIELPASVMNLKTQIITSEQPVRVHTDDFELTGEKMEFNTVDRTGRLLGHVHMHIRNLKQVAGPQQPPTP